MAADASGLQRLPRKIPVNIAAEMLPTGMAEAARLGLVNAVVQPGEVMEKARALAQTIADGAPPSVRAIKGCLPGMDGMTMSEAFDAIHERRFPVDARMLVSRITSRGRRPSRKKRKPQWKGR